MVALWVQMRPQYEDLTHRSAQNLWLYIAYTQPSITALFLYIYFFKDSLWWTPTNHFECVHVVTSNPSLSISKLSTGASNFSAKSFDVSETRMPQNARLANSCPLRNRHFDVSLFLLDVFTSAPLAKKKTVKNSSKLRWDKDNDVCHLKLPRLQKV